MLEKLPVFLLVKPADFKSAIFEKIKGNRSKSDSLFVIQKFFINVLVCCH